MSILTDTISRILYAIVMIMFGLFHFMGASDMAAMAPFGGVVIVYITGAALIAAGISIIIKKMASTATLLLGLYLLLTALLVHIPAMSGEGPMAEMAMSQVLKDLGLAAAAWFMSGVFKKEEAA